MKKLLLALSLLGFVGISQSAEIGDIAQPPGVALQVIGTGILEQRFIDGFEEPADCYVGMDVVDISNGIVVGHATDCLSEITDSETGVQAVGTTFFEFARGNVTVQGDVEILPVSGRVLTPEGMVVTHITGAMTSEENNVIDSTGIYEHGSANSRLQGAVNMDLVEEGIIQFSCFFLFTNIVPEE